MELFYACGICLISRTIIQNVSKQVGFKLNEYFCRTQEEVEIYMFTVCFVECTTILKTQSFCCFSMRRELQTFSGLQRDWTGKMRWRLHTRLRS